MQPRSQDPGPGHETPAEPRDRTSYAQEAIARAEQCHDEASASLQRVAERRVRYQEVLIRREIRLAELENERAAAIEQEQARLDAATDTEFLRDQIEPMLEDGWTLEQLQEIGITRDMLVSLDLYHDVARRSRGAH